MEEIETVIGDDTKGIVKDINDLKNSGGNGNVDEMPADLKLTGQKLQLKNSKGVSIGSGVTLPTSSGGNTETLEVVNHVLGSNVSKILQKIYSDRPKSIVSFVSDDMYIEDWNKRDWFKNLGCPYTIPVRCDWLNTPNKPTIEQLLELQNKYGYEIASHSATHPRLSSLTDNEIITELEESFNILNKKGLKCETFYVPFGAYDDRVLNYATRYYRCTRTSEEDYNRVGLDSSHIKSFWIDQYKSGELAKQKERLDYAIANNCWIIFSMHTGMMQESDFTTMVQPLIEYINFKKVPIMTVNKALDYFQNPIEVSSISKEGLRKRYFYIDCTGNVHSEVITDMNNRLVEQEKVVLKLNETIDTQTSSITDILSRLEVVASESGNGGGDISVSSVSIKGASLITSVGTSKKLECNIYPSTATNKNVRWSGDNNAIATITLDGIITGVATGKLNVTVTTEDGGFTDSKEVTVNGELVIPEGFILKTYTGIDENWVLDTSFDNHGTGFTTSIFNIPISTADLEITKNDALERNIREVNFKVVNGLTTNVMLTKYHDNAIVYRNGKFYVEIKNELLDTNSVGAFKSYLNENNLEVLIRKNDINKTTLYIDDGSKLEHIGVKGNYYIGITGATNTGDYCPLETDTTSLPYIDWNGGNYVELATGDFYTVLSKKVYIGISTSKLNSIDINGLNDYLKINPFVWNKNKDF